MLDWGVVNRVVPAAELLEKARVRPSPGRRAPCARSHEAMIQITVDEGVAAADAALPGEGARVMASEDLQNGARTLEKGPGQPPSPGAEGAPV